VLTGNSSRDEEKCVDGQVADAKAIVGSVEIESKQMKTKTNHLEKELKDKNKILSSMKRRLVYSKNT